MTESEITFLREKAQALQAELEKLKQDYQILSEEYKELKWRMEGLEK